MPIFRIPFIHIKTFFKSFFSLVRLTGSSVYHELLDEWLEHYFPPKPTVLQFPIIDICNSHCVMCNIWKHTPDDKIDLGQLKKILNDDLFTNIRYVGINGGEPTLHTDLPKIGKILVQSLPKLMGVGIITNAINPPIVIERIIGISNVMAQANISFGVSVSLDGIGEVHDRNRDVKGNFDAAMEVISTLRQRNIPVSIGCTLTPINCYEADDILLWCEQNKIKKWEFRIAVPIKRIYNEDYPKRHPFSDDQIFHLIMFFSKLSKRHDIDYLHRFFYGCLADQLAFGNNRKIGCDWQYGGVTLDARGNISYCSVQSPIIGSAIEESGWILYKNHLTERQKIRQHYCANCMHDLLGAPSTKELLKEPLQFTKDKCKSQILKIQTKGQKIFLLDNKIHCRLPARCNSPDEWQQVLITGWYGTETAGDKAILGELLHFIKTHSPNCKITITTLNKKVTNQTKIELSDLNGVDFIDIRDSYHSTQIKNVDAVILGGGPLEEINETEYIWRIFAEANRQQKARIIFGCGVGPLYSNHLQNIVGNIFQLTTAGFLRDMESRDYAIRLGGDKKLGCACDPALAYVTRWNNNLCHANKNDSQLRIAGLVRENTNEYITDMSAEKLKNSNSQTADQIAQMLEIVCKRKNAIVKLLPMHSIWIGGDDRIFNRQIAKKVSDPKKIYIERRYLPLNTLMESLAPVDAALAMRYHGHIFCMAMGIPFLSIDYTGKNGKVQNLIQRIDYNEWSLDWRAFDPHSASSQIEQLIDERRYWSDFLLKKTNLLINDLNRTYNQIFNL